MRNVRIWFSKTGDSRYISHLDLVRLFTRCIKRSGAPVWYTEGFNPHPHMAFALPLSVGIEGMREAADVKIEEDGCSDEEIFRRFAEVMPPDIAVTKVSGPVMEFTQITAAEYDITLRLNGGGAAELKSFLQGDIAITKPVKKKKGRRNSTSVSEVKRVEVNAELISFDQSGNKVNFRIILPAGGEVNINPKLVLDSAKNSVGEICVERIVRTRLLAGKDEFN